MKNIREDLASSIIIDCRIPTAIEFKSKLGFKQHDIIMTKEQSVVTKIMKVLASEEILLQHYVLGYTIELYFSKNKLAIEADEKGHKDKKKCDEDEREKTMKEHLDYEFFRINPDGKDFNIYVGIGKIHNHIIESTKKLLIEKISGDY